MNIWVIINFIFQQLPILKWLDGYKRILGIIAVAVAQLNPLLVQVSGLSMLAIPADILAAMLNYGSIVLVAGVAGDTAKKKVS
jgi:hypothetical protein